MSFDPRSFLDDIAGVDNDDFSEDSDEGGDLELDEWDGIEYEDALRSGRTRTPSLNTQTVQEETAEAETLAARFREMDHTLWRSSRSRVASAGPPPSNYAGVPTSIALMPSIKDTQTFGVFVTKGKEIELVIRFTRLYVEKPPHQRPVGWNSVFFFPKIPGRLYFEAPSLTSVQKLCAGMHFVNIRSIFFVPLQELVALMQFGSQAPMFKEGNWVKVRNGMYKGDVGIVVTVLADEEAAIVKLKSRETHPSLEISEKRRADLELERDGSRREPQADTNPQDEDSDEAVSSKPPSRKRKRARTQRREPHLLKKAPNKPELEDGSRIEITEDGFKFRGHHYTHNGHILLRYQLDRLERVSTGVSERDAFVAMESSNAVTRHGLGLTDNVFTPETDVISAPVFLNVDDRVVVNKGEISGATGTVNHLGLDTAVIDLDQAPGVTSDETSSLQMEIDLRDLTRLFDIGEFVRVQMGVHAGRTGYVGDRFENGTLRIADLQVNEILEVPSKYVDSFTSSLLPPTSTSPEPLANQVSLRPRLPVMVTKGKHEGKQGKISCLKSTFVILIEDVTKIELRVCRDQLRILPSKSNEEILHEVLDLATKAKRRDAFRALGLAIGIELDLFEATYEGSSFISYRGKGLAPDAFQEEGWTRMLDVRKRTQEFWRLSKSFGVERKDIVLYAGFGSNPESKDIFSDVYQLLLSRAFCVFAEAVSIEFNDGSSEETKVCELSRKRDERLQEQCDWEAAFMELARNLDISLQYIGLPQDDDTSEHQCPIDHRNEGFEGQIVYIWEGAYKGRLGKVMQMSVVRCKVVLESVIFGSSTVFIHGRSLIVKCACLLGDGRRPSWSNKIANVLPLFNRGVTEEVIPPPRPSTPPNGGVVEDRFHDSSSKGMWLFDACLHNLRKSNAFRVRIDSHPNSEVAGRHEGMVLIDPNPRTHPILKTVPPNVQVRYEIRKKNETHVKWLSVDTLSVTKPKPKGRHAVISGDRAGEVVIYVKSDGDGGQVYKEGDKRDTFYILKSHLCSLIES
ncbi:hypothetical protein SCHPADRAFT_947692 [Schizopora paradoxa]|uniref:Chromatin elongation factor SPT5 n=1 Tax=Schizopora paradoxa TaxID=27342 RepID=A0A0H2RI00_9AGAM|nr:hypothetical protein SCHPADRAFT_947692 [Schizopora paradoxa]